LPRPRSHRFSVPVGVRCEEEDEYKIILDLQKNLIQLHTREAFNYDTSVHPLRDVGILQHLY
jgi:hypothetical protein